SVIPAISAARTRRDKLGAGRIAESSLRMAALVACPAGVGLTVLAGPIIQLLYPTTDRSVAVPAMAVLGIASIFVCVMLLCNSILQANGFVNLPILVMSIGCGAKLLVNYFLVREIGIIGAPVGTLVCYVIVSILELAVIKRVLPAPPRYRRIFIKPMVASLLMGGAARLSYSLLVRVLSGISALTYIDDALGEAVLSRAGVALSTLGAIGLAVVVYGILIILLRAVSKHDLMLMPKGDKIARILRL
ncbi:MAG: polysaccharide biosynthesis protein, partial [Clostridiales bacterium]|nr:polysaccharide biosynthesis protein [Clostridiales bacterium]